jgi:hypothetical protein
LIEKTNSGVYDPENDSRGQKFDEAFDTIGSPLEDDSGYVVIATNHNGWSLEFYVDTYGLQME